MAAKAMFKPDAVLDGKEFSGITRLLEALHARKEAGVDKKSLESANDARTALEQNAHVAVDDLKALVKAAKTYQKAVEDDKLEPIPNVKDDELKLVVKKLEGMLDQQETTDEDGNKVHPAALPPGEEPEKSEPEEPAQAVKIVETPETKAKKDKQNKAQNQ